jgi:hypothetical protein
MHCLYFVKMKKDGVENARQAIAEAESILDANNFVVTDGYWGGGKCDWYVIGGRWSGALAGAFIKGDFYAEARKLVCSKEKNKQQYEFVLEEDRKKYADEIQQLWLALGGKNANPYARERHAQDGLDDDAAILTPELIDALKKKYPDKVEYFDSDNREEKSVTSLSAEDVGDWLVVVDYHF